MLDLLGILFLALLVGAILWGLCLSRGRGPELGGESIAGMDISRFEMVASSEMFWPNLWGVIGAFVVSAFWLWTLWSHNWDWPAFLESSPWWVVLLTFAASTIPPTLWTAAFFAEFRYLSSGIVVSKIAAWAFASVVPLVSPIVVGYGVYWLVSELQDGILSWRWRTR